MSELFYLQDKRSYVGNDILWWAKDGCGYTTDINKAEVYTKDQAIKQNNCRETDIPWPKEYIDARTRPAVDMQHVNHREALKGKCVLSKLRKEKRSRPTTGKTRGNCPRCGKISWGYDPHEHEYCSTFCRVMGLD